MSQGDLLRVLSALAILLTAAHLGGMLFARLRQPVVVGEILGGLLMGPTVLGKLAPGVQAWLFPTEGPVASGLNLVYQLGILLLMFMAGAEMRAVFSRRDIGPVGVIAAVGMAVPFAIGLLLVKLMDTDGIVGPAGSTAALTLIIASAIAVTSIPVISRIMMDLGIIRTEFARIVLMVAVLEDIVLNVIISVALGMAGQGRGEEVGLASLLGVDSAAGAALYHCAASITFFAVMVAVGMMIRRRTAVADTGTRGCLDVVTLRMAVILAVSGACIFLGVAPMLGAFVVGLLSGVAGAGANSEVLSQVRSFASGFFVPVYFAMVGVKLDLVHSFSLGITVTFVLVACAAKASSVFVGARITGRSAGEAVDLAVALNARGGPGIVLATVSFDAGIINASMFTTLVLTAIITSQAAGWWLQRVVSRGGFSSTDSEDRPVASAVPAAETPTTRIQVGSDPTSRTE